MKLLMDHGGLIEEVALCTPHGPRDRDLLRAHAHTLVHLPGEIAVALVCRTADAAPLAHWAGRLRAGVRIVPVDEINSQGMWTQDPMLVATVRGKRQYLRVVPEHPNDLASWLARGDGTPVQRTSLRLAGGNSLVGSDFRIIGAGAVLMQAKRATPARIRAAIAAHRAVDRRRLHIFGHGDQAIPHDQDPFHLDLALALTGCRTRRGEPIVLLAKPIRWGTALDATAERLRADGFHVLRNKVPMLGSAIAGYNNVLVENVRRPGERRPLLMLPSFGGRNRSLSAYDEANAELWSLLGFTVRRVPSWSPLSFASGALRCATKVLWRGEYDGDDRIIPDAVLRRIAESSG
jgi:hypothetical protein